MLMQSGGGAGIDHPLSYFAHTLNDRQMKHSTVEKETLLLILVLQHLEAYQGLLNERTCSSDVLTLLANATGFVIKKCLITLKWVINGLLN